MSARKGGHLALHSSHPTSEGVRRGAPGIVAPARHDPPSPGADRARVVEFVGPAGAGKTSLIDVLRACDPALRAPIRVSERRFLPTAAMEALYLVPTLIRGLSQAPDAAWTDLRYLLELNTLRRAVESARAREGGPILLDEGPAYVLARGMAFRPAERKALALDSAWTRAIARWSRTLDVIVWLDADDDVLAERIRRRRKAHRVKEASDAEIHDFLASYRDAYARVIDRLGAIGGTRLFRFDTSHLTVEQLAAMATRAIEGAARA